MKKFLLFFYLFFSQIAVAQTMRYTVVIPDVYDPQKLYGIVVAFHGARLSGNQMRGFMTNVESLSNKDLFFVYPDSLDGYWAEKDLGYFDEIVRDMTNTYPIDTRKIVVIGYSNGGFFANLLARYRSNVITGVISIAGGNSGSTMVPAMIVHGNRDRWVFFENGYNSAWNWSQINQCSERPARAAINSCVWLSGCQRQTVWCPSDADHDWPRFENADQQIITFINSIK